MDFSGNARNDEFVPVFFSSEEEEEVALDADEKQIYEEEQNKNK